MLKVFGSQKLDLIVSKLNKSSNEHILMFPVFLNLFENKHMNNWKQFQKKAKN